MSNEAPHERLTPDEIEYAEHRVVELTAAFYAGFKSACAYLRSPGIGRAPVVDQPVDRATPTADTITDAQICELRDWLFMRKRGDELELEGLVRCHEALGRSHRRAAARARCAEILNSRDRASREG